MFQAKLSNGIIIEGLTVRAVWYAVDHSRRYDSFSGEGLPGAVLYAPNGKKLHEWTRGDDMQLEDVEPSVRLYHCLVRRAWELGDEGPLTMGHLYEMALNGDLRKIRNLGRHGYEELLSLLFKYCGTDCGLMNEVWAMFPCKTYSWQNAGWKFTLN